MPNLGQSSKYPVGFQKHCPLFDAGMKKSIRIFGYLKSEIYLNFILIKRCLVSMCVILCPWVTLNMANMSYLYVFYLLLAFTHASTSTILSVSNNFLMIFYDQCSVNNRTKYVNFEFVWHFAGLKICIVCIKMFVPVSWCSRWADEVNSVICNPNRNF